MAIPETMDNNRWWYIDKRLLSIKIHYFLSFGAFGAVLVFVSVLAKSLNMHATAVGVIFTVVNFTKCLVSPLFGSISDYFRNIKQVIICLVVCVSITYLLILLIPPIKLQEEKAAASIQCQDLYSNTTLSMRYNPTCLTNKLQQGVDCKLLGKYLSDNKIYTKNTAQLCNDLDFTIDVVLNASVSVELFHCNVLHEVERETGFILPPGTSQNASSSSFCSSLASNQYTLSCTPSLESCSAQDKEDLFEVYRSYQFWMFLLLVMVGNCGASAIFSLSDAACYELLGDKTELYGRQRLFATISWGAIVFLAGYFNDLASESSATTSYSPGFYLMAVMSILDLIILWRVIDVKQGAYSSNIWKDIGSIFSSCRVVAFATGVMIVGGLSGMLWNYQFWYLQNLGANQLLLGLTVTVQCLAAEVPFFFFSGWIIDRLGHSLCLILTFVTFALRYFLYYLLTDPWYTLPIELLHGWTFGVFHSTMTSYARCYASPGTKATLQAVLGGLIRGLGIAIGNLLGGVGFDQLGGRYTFLITAMISASCSVAFTIVTLALRKQESTR